MATLKTTEFTIAGKGHVFTAPVDTPAMDLKDFDFVTAANETTGPWSWLGDTSAESMLELNSEGGDTTTKRTWDRENVRVIREGESVTATVHSVNVGEETFKVAFKGVQIDSDGSVKVGANVGANDRAIMIVMEDEADVSGMYLPNTSLRGRFPTFSTEEFTTIPIDVNVLSSHTQTAGASGPLMWHWFPPVQRTSTGAAA